MTVAELPAYTVIETEQFRRSRAALPVYVQKSLGKAIGLLRERPDHRSLHVHKIKRAPGLWQCNITYKWRLVYKHDHAGNLVLLNVGSHRLIDKIQFSF